MNVPDKIAHVLANLLALASAMDECNHADPGPVSNTHQWCVRCGALLVGGKWMRPSLVESVRNVRRTGEL